MMDNANLYSFVKSEGSHFSTYTSWVNHSDRTRDEFSNADCSQYYMRIYYRPVSSLQGGKQI